MSAARGGVGGCPGCVEYPGLEGFKVLPLAGVGGARVKARIEIGSGPGPGADEAAVEAEWSRLREANPRVFDGPILAVEEVRAEPGIVRVRAGRTTYKRLAVQNRVQTGTDQLSVTALVRGVDGAGVPRVLLGRRGMSTRIYGGMWELGPSGGIDPPAEGLTRLDEGAIVAQVDAEVEEEMEGRLEVRSNGLIAMTYDPEGRCWDFVLDCEAIGPAAAPSIDGGWEYSEAVWLRPDEVRAFDRDQADRIIAPTRALFRFLGWA